MQLRPRRRLWSARCMRSALLALAASGALGCSMAVLPSPTFAASGELQRTATFSTECDIGPNVFNVLTSLQVTLSTSLPGALEEGEKFKMTDTALAATLPAQLVREFEALEVNRVKGSLRRIEVSATNIEPSIFALTGQSVEGGIPFEATLEKEKAVTVALPDAGAVESPQLTVSGRAGSIATLDVPQAFAYGEGPLSEGRIEATGEGLLFVLSGYSSSGVKKIGPIQLACSTPSVRLASWEVQPPGPPPGITATYNLPATGAIEDSALSQSIPLPEGTTFTGHATYPETNAFPGYFSGEVHVPAFTGSLKLLGLIPIGFGMAIEDVKPFSGIPALTSSGEWSVGAAGAYSISIGSVSLLSLKIPTSCHSEQPLASSTLLTTTEAQARAGALSASFPAALTQFQCEGSLLGRLFGSALTHLLSGRLEVSVP